MVVTKVIQIKSSQSLQRATKYIKDEAKTIKESSLTDVARALRYIQNESKTILQSSDQDREFPLQVVDGVKYAQLVSTYGVVDFTSAVAEIEMTRKNARQVLGKVGNGGDVLAHHIIQSFSPEDDLSPQEIHEIGRKTVLELTGGEHEFVIATHVDKDHIHNHIIFNSTNAVTLKKFRWQKGTKRSLENISDKHAGLAGAKIIDEKMKSSRKDYVAYRKKYVFSYELKQRLNFLLKQSTSLEDFKAKAAALNIQMDTLGKEVKYKLLEPLGNKMQERFIRDRTLSKLGKFSIEQIEKTVAANEAVQSLESIKEAYETYQAEREEDFEMRLVVEPWQVVEETSQGIYLELEYGLGNQGLVLIPSRCVDRLDEGGYELFIRKKDWFYFTNPRDAQMNRAMSGETIAKQLSYDNGQVVINKHPAISKMNQLVREFNFLSAHGISDGKQFDSLADRFREQLEEIQTELDKLDERLASLNKAQAALLEIEEGYQSNYDMARQILSDLGLPLTTDKAALDKLIKEVSIERAGLKERLDSIVNDHRTYGHIRQNVQSRDISPGIGMK